MIYFAQADVIGHIKIGFHGGTDANDRIRELQTGCPSRLILLGTLPGGPETEADLHRKFAFAHVHGEWFKPVPELLAFIGQLPAGPTLGKTEIRSRFVQIKVLTVDGKRFSASLLDQLRERPIVDWENSEPHRPLIELGEPWGWIKRKDPASGSFLLIWQSGGVLYRFPVSRPINITLTNEYQELPDFPNTLEGNSRREAAHREIRGGYWRAWKAACDGWASLDQLFIGV